MSIHDTRSLPKWNAIRSKVLPSNVTAGASDSSLLNPRPGKGENGKRKEVMPVKLHRPASYFRSPEPRTSSCE